MRGMLGGSKIRKESSNGVNYGSLMAGESSTFANGGKDLSVKAVSGEEISIDIQLC